MSISFIVPCYNTPADMLRECVDSILELNLPAYESEIIIVDDGSDWDVCEYMSEYECNVRCLRQRHVGLGGARNYGLAYARGEYVQFVDSDDCLLPDAYRHILDYLRREQPDVLQFRFLRGESANGVKGTVHDDYTVPTSGREFLQHNNLRPAAWSYVFRRSIAPDLTFHPDITHEDELFTPQLFIKADRLVTTTTQAYFYRRTKGSITEDMSEEHAIQRTIDMMYVMVRLKKIEGMERRSEQLAVNLLYMSWKLHKSIAALIADAMMMKDEGLLPIPIRCYTKKHAVVSTLLKLMCFYKKKQSFLS